MEYRTLELTHISAKGLKKVNLLAKMDVYAVVSILGSHQRDVKLKTPVDKDGSSHPSWNFPMKFTIDALAAEQNQLILVIKLKCERMLGDKNVGEVHVPIKELLDGAVARPVQFVTYQVRKPSGKPKGELCFSYKFGEKVSGKVASKADEPVTAYPAPVPSLSSVYPPPPPQPYAAAAGAGPYSPQAGGYYPHPAVYPPPQPGYAGYQQQQEPPYGGYPPPPTHPGYGYPNHPGYGYPNHPGYGYPNQPDFGYPNQPGFGYPNQLGYGYPAQPGYG